VIQWRSLVLLIGAGLMIKSFASPESRLGFNLIGSSAIPRQYQAGERTVLSPSSGLSVPVSNRRSHKRDLYRRVANSTNFTVE
jgi:hypothetical protein